METLNIADNNFKWIRPIIFNWFSATDMGGIREISNIQLTCKLFKNEINCLTEQKKIFAFLKELHNYKETIDINKLSQESISTMVFTSYNENFFTNTLCFNINQVVENGFSKATESPLNVPKTIPRQHIENSWIICINIHGEITVCNKYDKTQSHTQYLAINEVNKLTLNYDKDRNTPYQTLNDLQTKYNAFKSKGTPSKAKKKLCLN